ncbi:hypothetical protein [Escherichia coli]|uniref:hypothetical protein n=1 Tax=Escherichia coli TaxID=562 RepID=UPI003D9C98CF
MGWLHAAVCHSLDPFCARISSYGDYVSQGALHGLKWWLLAVVAQAVWAWRVTYARMGCESHHGNCYLRRFTVPSAWGQVGVIAIAGIAGRLLFKPAKVVEHDPLPITVSHRAGCFGSRCSLSC